MEKDVYKMSRILYIIEAAVEYFISLAVSGAYLAKLTSALNLSDSITGILSSFVSLGCTFQLAALFLAGKQPVKRWVTVLHTLNQLFFALIYFVPFVKVPAIVKTIAFVALLLLGHAVNNVVYSPKINWFMALVDDDKRGVFTANKEIVSLIGGVLFSIGLGAVIDAFEAAGNESGALIFCGIGVFGLMMIHTATLILSKEKPQNQLVEMKTQQPSSIKGIGELFKNKNLGKIILLSVIWYVANYATIPFYGTYQIKELGFTMLRVSILTSIGSLSRAIFSRPFGKFADKFSFVNMINVCYLILLLAYVINIFTVPSNGKVMYAIFIVLQSISMGGISSGEINLVYDYVEHSKRISALAIKGVICGIVGFLTTLFVSMLVEKIQANGNSIFGIKMYAQQVVSIIGAVVTALGVIYINLVLRKTKKLADELPVEPLESDDETE